MPEQSLLFFTPDPIAMESAELVLIVVAESEAR
jgi:hypothetical protein